MPLVDVVVLAVVFIGVGTFVALRWHPEKRRRKVQGIEPAVIARLGEPLARWCVSTRELVAALEVFREHSERMRALEEEFRDWPRGVKRQVRDANYLVEIRQARSAGEAWIDEAAALPETARRVLAEHDIDPEQLRDAFAFPWGLTTEHDRKRDRSDEVDAIMDAIDDASARLVAIERTLTALGPSPYR